MNQSKQNILNRIRSVKKSLDADFILNSNFKEVFQEIDKSDLLQTFIDEATIVGAQVFVLNDSSSLLEKIRQISEEKKAVVFTADEKLYNSISREGVDVQIAPTDLSEIQMGISNAECFVARTGSLLLSSFSGPGRRMNVFPPIHIVLAHILDLVEFPEDAIDYVQKKFADGLPSQISFVTGPSRTADIEKTLVMGAHGPKELIIFVKNY